MNKVATMRALGDGRGAVRAEDVYDTDIDDLWQACTQPDRLARWIAQVSGQPEVDAMIEVTFTSSWNGPARIEVCDAPRHLLVSMEPGGDEETQLEAWLTAEGRRTRLVVEERGLALSGLHFYGAGWQAHLDDLARYLTNDQPVHPEGWSADAPAPDWHTRWSDALPAYQELHLT